MMRSLTALVVTLLASPAWADTIEYQIGSHTQPGFSASWLHTADSSEHNGYWMNGDKTGLTGLLSGEWDPSAGLSNLSGTLHAANGGTITITGGFLNIGGNGSLEYTASGFTAPNVGHDLTNSTLQNPFLFVANVGPSIVSETNIILWGQNFAPTAPGVNPPADGYGLDLYGANPVPEPATLALLGIGAMGLAVQVRRKKRKTA